MQANLVYLALWHLVHFLYSLAHHVHATVQYLHSKLTLHRANEKINVLRDIHQRTSTLQKIPQHLTVLLGQEEPSYKDLSKLVVWSLTSGITFISFFDSAGKLKQNESELRYELSQHIPKAGSVIWHAVNETPHTNGYTGKRIHVKLFCPLDAHRAVAQSCRTLSQLPDVERNIDGAVVDKQLRELYEFPDPMMAIYFGENLRIDGYPPWQIRFTEFLDIRTHRDLSHHTYVETLYRYNKREQRFGK